MIRAGYGVYYDTSVYQTLATQMAQQFPLSKSLSVQNTPTNPLTLANGFNVPRTPLPIHLASIRIFAPATRKTGQLSIQRDLPGSLQMTATYLGIKGTHGTQEFLAEYLSGWGNQSLSCLPGRI